MVWRSTSLSISSWAICRWHAKTHIKSLSSFYPQWSSVLGAKFFMNLNKENPTWGRCHGRALRQRQEWWWSIWTTSRGTFPQSQSETQNWKVTPPDWGNYSWPGRCNSITCCFGHWYLWIITNRWTKTTVNWRTTSPQPATKTDSLNLFSLFYQKRYNKKTMCHHNFIGLLLICPFYFYFGA